MNLDTIIEGFWDTLIYDTPEDLEQFIQDVDADASLYPHRHDIYHASYSGLTPMEFVFDDQSKRHVLQKIYND